MSVNFKWINSWEIQITKAKKETNRNLISVIPFLLISWTCDLKPPGKKFSGLVVFINKIALEIVDIGIGKKKETHKNGTMI